MYVVLLTSLYFSHDSIFGNDVLKDLSCRVIRGVTHHWPPFSYVTENTGILSSLISKPTLNSKPIPNYKFKIFLRWKQEFPWGWSHTIQDNCRSPALWFHYNRTSDLLRIWWHIFRGNGRNGIGPLRRCMESVVFSWMEVAAFWYYDELWWG